MNAPTPSVLTHQKTFPLLPDHEAKFRALFETALDGILVANDQGCYIDANPAACSLLGMRRDNIIGRPVTDFADPRRKDEVRDAWRRFLREGEQKGFFRIYRPDGTTRHVDYTAKAHILPGQHLSILRDITERNEAERSLRASEDRYRTLITALAEGIILVEETGKILTCNVSAERILGLTQKEILERPFTDIRQRLVQEDGTPYSPEADPIAVTLRTGVPLSNSSFGIRYPDGTTAWMSANTQPLMRSTDEKPYAVVCSFFDVTERRESQRQLEAAKEAAETAANAKSQFVANISHEIRTPLNGILGTLDLLRQTRLTSEQHEYAKIMGDSSETLMTLINELLDFSRIEAGKIKLEVKDFDLEALVEMTRALFVGQRARSKKLKAMWKVDPGIPSRLRGDPVRLRQVLSNLIGNAIKFTEHGKVLVSVSKEAEDAALVTIRFAVQDTGPGIPPSQQQKLFKPFSQIDSSATREHSGTGLGLAICKQLVERMGGAIGVKSTGRKGSTFWFSLPLQKQNHSSRPETIVPKKALRPRTPSFPSPTMKQTRSWRILVAEDNKINRLVAVRQLQKLGYVADTAANGRDVLNALKKKSYDLIFMDCQMPGMDGYQATAEIRRRESQRRHTKIIAMTAHALEEDREKCLAAGMDDYISKPVPLVRLRAALKQWLGTEGRGVRSASSASPLHSKALIRLYVRTTSRQLEQLKRAVRSQSAGDVKEIAHSCIGASALLRLNAIVPPLRQLERMGIQGKFHRAEHFLRQTQETFERMKNALPC